MADLGAATAKASARRGRAVRRDPDTPEPVEIAMRENRGTNEARDVLEKQARLIDAQEVLARADLRHRGWQIIGERVGAALKGLTAVAGILVLGTAAAFVWSAAEADGMVVEAFAVPPEMERRGFTGAVVAAQLLDRLNAIEGSTQSARAPSSYDKSWGEDSSVVVPYAGVSLGELRRELREWLGSETRLSGEIVRLADGRVAIAFRTGGAASGRVEGTEADLDGLMQQAARAIFRKTQPYRYSVILTGSDDWAERREVLTELSRSPDLKERLWAMHGLALDAGSDAQSKAIYERALRLRPDFLPAIGNLPYYALAAGNEEEALGLFRRAAAAFRKGQEDYNPLHAAGYAKDAAAEAADLVGDVGGAARIRTSALEDAADVTNLALRPFEAALSLAELHDFGAARATLDSAGYLDPTKRAELETRFGALPSLRLLHAIATGDAAAEAAELELTLQAATGTLEKPDLTVRQRRIAKALADAVRVPLATALARAGRAQEAAAAIAPLPMRHDAALRTRGLTAAYAGRHGESDALFTQAVARAPSLPLAHQAWAEALMVRGETDRAISQAQLAHRKGPRWAEPLRLLGDALARQGKAEEAVAFYARAAERAPRWGRLHVAWADALWRLGKRDEARAKLGVAATMALTDADRQLLRRMWSKAAAKT